MKILLATTHTLKTLTLTVDTAGQTLMRPNIDYSIKLFADMFIKNYLQEAQLSQRDRATLRVIEYFAKSLKITQGHSKWHCLVERV